MLNGNNEQTIKKKASGLMKSPRRRYAINKSLRKVAKKAALIETVGCWAALPSEPVEQVVVEFTSGTLFAQPYMLY